MSVDTRLAGLVPGLCPELSVLATPAAGGVVAPGNSVAVDIEIKNNGAAPVFYVQGSGSFRTPQALFLAAEGLQPVLPADHTGPATMDYVTKQLAAGEVMRFTLYLRAIAPDPDFDNATFELYNRERLYIAELSWAELHRRYPTLCAAAPGRYACRAYFTCTPAPKDGAPPFISGPEGYAEGAFDITVEA